MLAPIVGGTLKRVFAPHLGREVVFGRRKRLVPARCRAMSSYIRVALPAAPASCDYSPKALPVLTDIMGNDALGDCVVAASDHGLGTWTGNATGTPVHATLDQIIAQYSAIGGYVPGNPATDQGCDISTALDYYAGTGFIDGSKLLGHVSVDPTNQNEVKSSVELFETLWLGMDLPAAWIDPMPSGNGFVWDVAGDLVPENGHCVLAVGYTAQGLIVASWGLLGIVTWAAVAKYCAASAGGDLFCGLSPDLVAKGQASAPNGFAWADLIADFDAIGGSVATPANAPIVPVTGPMTLALAQQAAAAGIAGGGVLMTRAQAQQRAAIGLAGAWPKAS